MRLSRIRLSGFKTFVDATTLELPGSLTGIVGPNGCGKSNIIDAVRWVLGESSARSLRAEAGTDVIFNGSGGRKPAGRAMVELSFDNADGQAGGAWGNVAEIAVRRELSRDGQSAWFLNNRRALKRDVQDVFLGTGLGGRQQYAILEQGSIARLVEARPEELRHWLEEAAGISRYRERRRETADRVAGARGNLATLEATRHDLATRVATLARQAEEALFWRDAKREERALTLAVLALAARGARAEAMALETAGTKAREIVARADAAEIDATQRLAVARATTDAARLADALAGADTDRRLAEADTATATLTVATGRARTARAEVDAARGRIEALASRRVALETARIQTTAAADTAALAQVTAAEAETSTTNDLAALVATDDEVTARLAGVRDVSRPLGEQRLALAARAEALAREARALDQQRSRLDTALATLAVDDLAAPLALLASRLEEARQAASAAAAALQLPETELLYLREELPRLETQAAGATREHDTELARQTGLETLQAAALNADDRVRRAWLDRQGLAQAPRLADQVRAPEGWETAIERVLADAGVLDAPLSATPAAPGNASDAPASGGAVLTEGPITERAFGHGRLESPAAADPWLEGLEPALVFDPATRETLAGGQGWLLPDGTRVYRYATVWARRRPGDGVLARARVLDTLRRRVQDLAATASVAREALSTRRAAITAAETARRDAASCLIPARAAEARADADHRATQLRAAQAAERQAALRDERTSLLARASTLENEQGVVAASLLPLEDQITILRAAESTHQIAHAEARRRLDLGRLDATAASRRASGAAVEAARAEAARDAATRALADLAPQEADAAAEHDRRLAIAQDAESQLAPLETTAAVAQARTDAARAQRIATGVALADAETLGRVSDGAHADARQAADEARNTVIRLTTQAEDASRRDAETALRFWQEDRLQAQAGEGGDAPVSEAVVDGLPAAVEAADIFLDRPDPAAVASRLAAFLAETSVPPGLTDAEARLARVRRRLDRMGAVNLTADTERTACAERLAFLDAQRADLLEALAALEEAIHTLDAETRQVFDDIVTRVDITFAARFTRLFGGGTARLERTEADWLTAGVRVVAQPPGKKNAVIQLLSGGEKAMTALALLLALFEQNPAPFCLLDEVDAPLDDANVGRFCDTVREMSARVQFIVITHNKLTMELATHLHGVTMREPGVSRLVGVDLDAATRLAGAAPPVLPAIPA